MDTTERDAGMLLLLYPGPAPSHRWSSWLVVRIKGSCLVAGGGESCSTCWVRRGPVLQPVLPPGEEVALGVEDALLDGHAAHAGGRRTA